MPDYYPPGLPASFPSASVKSLRAELEEEKAAVNRVQGELDREKAAVKSLERELEEERAEVSSLNGLLHKKETEVHRFAFPSFLKMPAFELLGSFISTKIKLQIHFTTARGWYLSF